MGHAGHLRAEYSDLADRLNRGYAGMPEPSEPSAHQAWVEILEILYTPEEAALAARLPVAPRSLRTLSKRVGMSPEELQPRLDAMCDKGLVMDLVNPETGRTKYLLSPPVIGFFEFTFMRAEEAFPRDKIARAMEAYMHGDPVFAAEVFGKDTNLGRAMVREEHLSAEALPDVLDWERATEAIDTARNLALSQCYCRHKAEHLGKSCDAPMEICLSMNAGADFVVRRKFGRPIERSEARDVLELAKSKGLVQIADNVQDAPSYMCNCCACCCGQLRSVTEFDLHAVNPSGFEPHIDDELCNGCSRCARACPVTAMSMAGVRVEGRRKTDLRPRVDADRCIGCGVCASACKRDAMSMEPRAERPTVPQNGLERVLRQAMERGRLNHLLFDEGASRGATFLNQAMHALGRLPGAQRALASEQVRSRFVRAALSRTRSPI